MSTSNYRDSVSFVNGVGKADDYSTLQNYSDTGNSQSAPLSSVLKLSVAPGSDKYYSVQPSFQARMDNVRIAPPSMTPISIGTETVRPDSNTASVTGERGNFAMSSEYARLTQSYKLN